MARHATITATGLPVFFAHPHSPWERGSNENLNRIVREYFPKGETITSDPTYLAMVASDINDRHRKIHNWKKPSELFTELVEDVCFDCLNLPLAGAVRGKTVPTTIRDKDDVRAADLVRRQFAAGAPNRLRVADFTYVSTWACTVYVAFAIDMFSRKIVGWRASMSKETDLVLDAIDRRLRDRRYRPGPGVDKLVHHSDAGVSIRLSGSPSIWWTQESTRRSGRSGMPWTMRSRNPRLACTRPR
jgi:Integrase core domain